MINGLDLSNVNGQRDLAALKRQHHLSFAFFKATEGLGFRDSLFPAAWKTAKTLGLARGGYHFGRPATDATAQADAFLTYVRAAGLDDTDMLALDLEVGDGRRPADVAAWGREFCGRVHADAGRLPLVYTFLSFTQAGNCAGLGNYPLWIADPSSAPGKPRVPAPWSAWSVHQYGQQGIDLDVGNYPDGAAMTAALTTPKPATGWTTAMIANLPTLQQGNADHPGSVQFVRRIQALVKVIGDVNKIPAASAVTVSGSFDATTQRGVLAIQALFGLTQDGVCGPLTWTALITGQHG